MQFVLNYKVWEGNPPMSTHSVEGWAPPKRSELRRARCDALPSPYHRPTHRVLATPWISFWSPFLPFFLCSPNTNVPLNNTGLALLVFQLHSKCILDPSATCLWKFRSVCLRWARTEVCGCILRWACAPASRSVLLLMATHSTCLLGVLPHGSPGHLGLGLLGGGPGALPTSLS